MLLLVVGTHASEPRSLDDGLRETVFVGFALTADTCAGRTELTVRFAPRAFGVNPRLPVVVVVLVIGSCKADRTGSGLFRVPAVDWTIRDRVA